MNKHTIPIYVITVHFYVYVFTENDVESNFAWDFCTVMYIRMYLRS